MPERTHWLQRGQTHYEFRACIDFGPGGVQRHDAATVAEANDQIEATREVQRGIAHGSPRGEVYPIVGAWVEVREVSDWSKWPDDRLEELARIVQEVQVPERPPGPGLRGSVATNQRDSSA